MEKNKGEFTGDVFESLLTQQELPHLLYSELDMITKKIGEEFPEIITTGTFGKTWEDRDLKYIKLDARKDKTKNTALSETESAPSAEPEKKESVSDEDFIKSLGKDVSNVYVQLDQEISTIKKSLKKNLVGLAQVGHIDQNLLKLKDDDDNMSSGDSSNAESKKKEEIKSISQIDSSES